MKEKKNNLLDDILHKTKKLEEKLENIKDKIKYKKFNKKEIIRMQKIA